MNASVWPRLATLPTTNALLALVGSLWLLTGICALMPFITDPADRWYQGLETFSAIIVVQFAAKRYTNGRGTNGNGHGEVPKLS